MFLYSIGVTEYGMYDDLTVGSSDADYYVTSPFIIPQRCRIDKIGVRAGNSLVSGNIILAVHKDKNGSPSSLVCKTASTDVTTLTNNDVNFVDVVNPPVVEAGMYWVGFIISENYVPATSGMEYITTKVSSNAAGYLDGSAAMHWQNVGSFTVPDPFISGGTDTNTIRDVTLKVTVI